MTPRTAHMVELIRLLELQGAGPTDHLRLMVRLTEFSLAGISAGKWSKVEHDDALDFAIRALGRSRVGASNLSVSSKVLDRLRRDYASDGVKAIERKAAK